MLIHTLKKEFERGNVSVCGLRGTGKDMLTANIVARRKRPYISNIDYHCDKSTYIPLELSAFNCENNYHNFIENNINLYRYPYADDIDVYISDCGVVMPSTYQDKLTREYGYLPTFFALSRQLGQCNVHTNSQSLSRVWDKIREQSDIYVNCRWCKVFGKIVLQKIYIYERYESALNQIAPFRAPPRPRGMDSQTYRTVVLTERTKYDNTHGKIRAHVLIYFNKSKYDTRYYKTLLEK